MFPIRVSDTKLEECPEFAIKFKGRAKSSRSVNILKMYCSQFVQLAIVGIRYLSYLG